MSPKHSESSYLPLFVVISSILLASSMLEISQNAWEINRWMRHFMGLFLIIFSMFKLFDLDGFTEGFKKYDIVAGWFPFYGNLYPFVELGLGMAYLAHFEIFWANTLTICIMSLGALGVARSIWKKMDVRCACLGTVLNVPLSWVTLIEDLSMVAMAATMLFMK